MKSRAEPDRLLNLFVENPQLIIKVKASKHDYIIFQNGNILFEDEIGEYHPEEMDKKQRTLEDIKHRETISLLESTDNKELCTILVAWHLDGKPKNKVFCERTTIPM
uniref:Uncharacterized protein n=1 Tax=viral metagenome TaxID=1070528 RepID=A0A6C0J5Y5_9ZZZZ